MSPERKKIIAVSAPGADTSSIFRRRARPGGLEKKLRKESAQLRLTEIINSCPEEFLPSLVEILNTVRLKHKANPKELVMVAEAIIASREAYIKKEVKQPMTPEEAIKLVRQFLEQPEPQEID